MADNTLDVRIKQKYDTEANWNSKNPVLLEGEVGYIPDGRFKVGNGTSTWSQLSYNKADPTTHTHTKSQITDFPTSLKNPNALTIQGNGTTLTNGTYDGSVAKTVNITPSSIGAVSTSEFQNQLNKKIDIAQGAENYGKILAINESGNAVTMTAPESTDITYDETKGRLVISSKSNLPGNTGVDPTLSVSGEAADAKVTGMLKSRVDALTSLKEGSTTGDAELQDIRVGSDGTLYSSAGESVRTQISALKGNLALLSDIKHNVFPENANRFNVETITPGFLSNDSGTISGTSGNYVTSDFIFVADGVGKYLCFSKVNSSNVIVGVADRVLFFESKENPIANTFSTGIKYAVIPDNAMYARISFDNVDGKKNEHMAIISDNDTYLPTNAIPYVVPTDIAKIKESAVPSDLKFPNPKKLKFVGGVESEYDGVEEVIISIPETLPNPIEHNIIVGTSSGADYNTITDAIASINDSSAMNIYNIMLEDGVYEEKDIALPQYVNLIGISGIKENVHIKGENPDSATDSDITPSSTINLRYSNVLKNITVTCKNMRYPVHHESGNAVYDWTLLVENCHIEHLGNGGAKVYRESNNLTETDGYNSLWTSCHGWGEGASQGAYALFKDSVFKSVETAWYVHEGSGQTTPYLHEFECCEFISTNDVTAPQAVRIDNTNDVPVNVLKFRSCVFCGGIDVNALYPIRIIVDGNPTMVRAMWKNGTNTVQSYFSDKCHPIFTNHMEEKIYDGDVPLVGGEFVAFTSPTKVVKATSETLTELVCGVAIGSANKGDKILILTKGYIYNTSTNINNYYGVSDTSGIKTVTDKSKAVAKGLGGWFAKLL